MHELDFVFRPRSVAVIGASQHPGKIGWEIVHNIIKYGFRGKLFPVNPKADYVHSIKSYRNVTEIPDDIDLAMITVPREQVLEIVDECARKGVRGLIMITAGFKEVNEAGARQEEILGRKIREYGMRMVGPNCMGIINTDPGILLDATFAPELPVRGKIGFISQSGALGVTILSLSRERNVGFSMFASIGNKTNLSSNDLLEYWERDPDTDLVLLYLENFGNPRRFAQIARRFTNKKPIIAVKSGRTVAGARAASSHTGALANLDVATDAIFDQYGVIRAATIDELFDYATALSTGKLPRDNRVAILTNAGGPGIMATDACVSLGLQLAEYEETTIQKLREIIPAESNPNNPLDLLAGATPVHYKRALEVLLEDQNVSSVLVISVPPIMVNPVEVATTVSEIASHSEKPVLGCVMGVKDILRTIQQTAQKVIPLFAFPESAARALHGMVQYAEIRARKFEPPRHFLTQKKDAEELFQKARQENRTTLTQKEMKDLLSFYGIPTPPMIESQTEDQAVAASEKLGYPVVMKVIFKTRQHKSDLGGVRVDLRNAKEVSLAFQEMQQKVFSLGLQTEWGGVYLQPMIRGGKEVILGMSYDPTFGPLIMFGMGGIYVETMKDTIFRIAPITDTDARTMIRSIRAYPVLKGVRGEPGVDIDFLSEMLQRLSQMVTDFHFIREVEINPFIVSAHREQSLAVDARILLDSP